MAKTANINIRIEPEIKNSAEKLFSNFGITLTDAINIFLHKSIMEGGLPFDVKYPNKDTMAAMLEAERIAGDSLEKGHSDLNKLFEDLKSW